MPSPFPGFDPYLENLSLWRGVHNLMIANITTDLNRILPPGFDANIEERVYLVQPDRDLYPDVLITGGAADGHPREPARGTATLLEDPPLRLTVLAEETYEPYVEVRMVGAEERVVTIIEILCPTNKTHDGRGYESYFRKQQQILDSEVHLLEVDLLRDGLHTVAAPREALLRLRTVWDYMVCLHRGGEKAEYEYWPISLRDRLPRVRVPLTEGYPDVILDLQACFERAYDSGPYHRRVDYRVEPMPPFTESDAAWADALLRAKGIR